ncbi:PspC domain-containing protein [Aestuariimicrobium ganziense]|uniref:PspC domain-containing protein n=1 Tax=Aestuariimicrobium ganziense TaxID=2773677 RepID=UPI001940C8F8|nr:PspC domain-containing protein [Aestuariimicrobium ganziense]
MTDHQFSHETLTTDTERPRPVNYSTGKLVRSNDRMIAGVCSAIAKATKLDVGLVRIIAVVLAFVTSGVGLAIYLAAWAILPSEGESSTMLDSLIETGKKQYSDYKANKDAAQPGAAPRAGSTETFDPYAEDDRA